MSLQKYIYKRPKRKRNPIELALQRADAMPPAPLSSAAMAKFHGFADFLKNTYGICDLRPAANIICNTFFIGINASGQRIFIKTGQHAGIYENEYRMGHALWSINSEHFLKPLYYNDYDKYKFFANEYVPGISLNTAMITGRLGVTDKARLIGDIWKIFCALRDSDVVHRDIRPDNLMIMNGRLVLIDFQLAVSKSNYVELEYLAKHPNRLRKLGNKKYRYHPFTWDDAYSLAKVLEFIGRDKFYAKRYDIIYKNIKAYIGTDKIKSSIRENDLHRMVRHIRQMRI
ncbi:MAG: hypothetical protein K2I81_03770 [Alphaproteobacteria bacterium]|nr:hypothetical protein [Alphaproteobacteria bacterium]